MCLFIFAQTHAQLSIQGNGITNVIDFDNAVSDVNEPFGGSGLTANPAFGQLDADAWAITGFSDGAKAFGVAKTSGDFARGSSSGGVSTGGLYAFSISGSGTSLGVQPGGSDWTPGTITLKVVNGGSTPINTIDIAYTAYVRNDQDRGNTLGFSYSTNDVNYTSVSALTITSTAARDATPSWQSNPKTTTLVNLDMQPGGTLYLRWTGNDLTGSGSRDEFAIDDISVTAAGSVGPCTEPSAQATNMTFGTITSNFVQGSFNNSDAGKYLVLMSTSNTLTGTPADGVIYSSGSILGNAEVIKYGTSNSFSVGALDELTTYYFYVFGANDNCEGGPDYYNVNPLSGAASTLEAGSSSYYSTIGNQTCADLKTALHGLIGGHTSVSYSALWTHYQTTDDRTNDAGNATIVWDMYSDNPNGSETEFTFVTDQCGSYAGEGSCYNREHSFPKSFWGGTTNNPMYTDMFTVVPVDGWINSVRNNHPYGEVVPGTESNITSNGSRTGTCAYTMPGYTGTVFEPIDAYKGDLARGYFYMATRYEDQIASWENFTAEGNAIMDGTAFPAYEPWFLNMLVSWHNLDPVSQKEIDRNEAIYGIQGNRNPFIDHPEYVAMIWGDCSGGSDIQAPSAPLNLTASNITQSSTGLSWSPSSDNVGVIGYRIYQDGLLVGTSTSTSTTIAGLSAATSYDFQVSAVDAAGNESSLSSILIVTTTSAADTQAPTTPANLTASNVTTSSVDLSWSAATDNVGVTGYNVYQDGFLVATVANTNTTIAGLSASTNYVFQVSAVDAAGNESNLTSNLGVTTSSAADTQAPTTPTNLTASNVTTSSVDLSWSAATDNVGVTGYNVYQGGVLVATVANTNTTIAGLSASTNYVFQVSAVDAAGNESSLTSNLGITTATAGDTQAPSTPTAFSGTNITETSVDLSWFASSDNVGVTGYNVYQNGVLVATVTGTSTTISGLTPATNYVFQVSAIDAAGNESNLTSNLGITTDTPTGGPTVLHEGYFESGWDGWSDGGGDCDRYTGSYAYEGAYAIRIRDNSGTASSMTSPTLDLSGFTSVTIEFSFYVRSMENNEDFWLRYNGGSGWTTVETYVSGSGISNNNFYTRTVTLSSADYNLAANGQFRFQCDASGNNDQIYIDQVIITGSGNNLLRANNDRKITVADKRDDVSVEHDVEETLVEKASLNVYPNPATDLVNFDLSNIPAGVKQIVIYNLQGSLIEMVQPNGIIQAHNVSDYKSGIYFVRILDQNNEMLVQRFVVR